MNNKKKKKSGKYGILIGPSLSNAFGKTRTSVAGQTQQAGLHLISGLRCCDWSECLKCRIILKSGFLSFSLTDITSSDIKEAVNKP